MSIVSGLDGRCVVGTSDGDLLQFQGELNKQYCINLVLHLTALNCTVLYCTTLQYTLIRYAIRYDTIHCSVLRHTILSCTLLLLIFDTLSILICFVIYLISHISITYIVRVLTQQFLTSHPSLCPSDQHIQPYRVRIDSYWRGNT